MNRKNRDTAASFRSINSHMNGVSRWIILAILAAVLTDMWKDEARAQLIDPGPLSKPHAKLDTKDQCFKCHASGHRAAPDRLCGKCHKDIWTLQRKGKGLHGKKYKKQKCPVCHTDHRGRQSSDHDVTSNLGFESQGAVLGIAG